MKYKKRTKEHLFSFFFMINVYTCLRENKTSAKFGLESPSATEYLDTDRSHYYDGDDADQDMLIHLNTEIYD